MNTDDYFKKILIVFAKEPVPGRVKTRMLEVLSSPECAGLYKAMLLDTIKLSSGVKCDRTIIAYSSEGEPSYIKSVTHGMELYSQEGKDLGERMLNAFKFSFSSGGDRTVIIGSDSPTLPVPYINRAYELLDVNDIVLGPTLDGGYYLIGCKDVHDGLFAGIEWSSGNVLGETLKKASLCGKTVSILNAWYDVDTPSDLSRLYLDLNIPDPEHHYGETGYFLRSSTISDKLKNIICCE